MKNILTILSLLLLFSCNQFRSFDEKLISTFKEHGLYDSTFNWDRFESEVKAELKKSKKEGIQKALDLYGNKHTFYRLDNEMLFPNLPIDDYHDRGCTLPIDSNIASDTSFAYVKVNGFMLSPNLSSSERKQDATNYIKSIYKQIKEQSKKKSDYWVIDLSYNGGGNMWPMIIGLKPFFNEGVLGQFIKREGKDIYEFKDNDIYYNGTPQTKFYLKEELEIPEISISKVAVIISLSTASSGEAVAIALTSLPNIKFLGSNSSGLTTGNSVHKIENGEYLTLTSSIMADYKGKKYGGKIKTEKRICDYDILYNELIGWK